MQAYNRLNGISIKHKLASRLLPEVPLGEMHEYRKISKGQDPGQGQKGTATIIKVEKD
jgi:hypothetical protein